MTLTSEPAPEFAATFERLVAGVERAVVGKTEVIRLALTCLLSEGHLLLEDFPGTGKTSLARALAQSQQGRQSRIQFTPDLLPSDVTGITIYDQKSQRFEFHRGPIFANIVLADEINRASPKTQSALLEVMAESHVTVDGVTHDVGRPFMVIATQNPIEQAGTYRLPEAQLDRFLMKTSIGYPDRASTVRIFAQAPHAKAGLVLDPVVTPEELTAMIDHTAQVHVDTAVHDYVAAIVEATREAPEIVLGASVRAGLALVRAAKTRAATVGRGHVLPEDVKRLVVPVLAHRLVIDPEDEFRGASAERSLDRILSTLAVPQESVRR